MGITAAFATVCLNREDRPGAGPRAAEPGTAAGPPGDTALKLLLDHGPASVPPSAAAPPRCRLPVPPPGTSASSPAPAMAAPRCSWLVFGFSTEEAAGEPSPGLGPRRLEPGPGGIRRVWPAWSYVVVETGAGLEVRSAGRRRRLRGWCEALPSETHLVLRGATAARAWRRGAGLRAPSWSRALPRGPPWHPLPLLPGGFATPRPPFYRALPAGLRARRLALGSEHVLVLGASGELHAWGGGRHGQLGHGTLESEAQPRLVEALAGVPMGAVAAGGWHSASVSEAGDLYMWGWNESGQLALPCKALAEERAQGEDAGAGAAALSPCQEQPAAEPATFISIQALPALLDLPQEAEVSEVSCGSRHTAAVTRGGELYTWGWGKYGQLGHGDDASSDRPRRVEHLVTEGLRAEAVVCGPWTTYVCVREPPPPPSTPAACGEEPTAAGTSPGPTLPSASQDRTCTDSVPQELNLEPEAGLQVHEG
ncbi:RCC1 domain-containing protein 1 isoform X2 [Pezoporus occidentalis]|uniref:RCC1 domain-containing protein 1 isoform X2 n=1 Tax=Pezoporus occidentalis TaxID=407982 RepID=UPI002F90E52B